MAGKVSMIAGKGIARDPPSAMAPGTYPSYDQLTL